MNYPDDINQYGWHPDSPYYDGDRCEHEDTGYIDESEYFDDSLDQPPF